MSRSGLYEGDGEDVLAEGRWRGAVLSAINGKRGQAFLRETLAALDALPAKRLVAEQWETSVTGMPFALKGGDVCALGAVGRARKIDMTIHDPEDEIVVEKIADEFGIALALAREMVWINDDRRETPEERFVRVREWVMQQIKPEGE